MEIKTKWNIGDNVYFIGKNKVTYAPVTNIKYNHKNEGEKLSYSVGLDLGIQDRYENELFFTKEELIASL